MEKPWAVYITWPQSLTPVKSGEYSNRISAEMSKQWLERRLTGYLKIEVVWIDESRKPPTHWQHDSPKRWESQPLSIVAMRRIER